jgi:hypothetical protein
LQWPRPNHSSGWKFYPPLGLSGRRIISGDDRDRAVPTYLDPGGNARFFHGAKRTGYANLGK